jgi:hypothetical protein
MTISEAHRKLGHIAHTAIKHAISQGHITSIELDPDSKPEFCEPCAKVKSARQPFPKESQTRTTEFGERVHWDLWGPASVKSLSGNYYATARIDDATHENMLYFQVKKSKTFNSYKKDEVLIETQSGNHIKVTRCDRGGEFLSKEMIEHQDEKGTIRELTVHDSPPQNGTSEHGMHTRAEHAQALLIASGLPRFLWEEAFKHSNWLQNRTPAHAIKGKTPYEIKNNKKPHLAGIQEFGAAAYVKDLKAGKLDARAKVGRFVGYDLESKGYRIYWPNKRSVTVERNVVFNEDDVLTTDDITIIPGNTLAEGERDKIIQPPSSNNAKHDNVSEPELEANPQPEAEPTNSIPFPSEPETVSETQLEPLEYQDEPPQMG